MDRQIDRQIDIEDKIDKQIEQIYIQDLNFPMDTNLKEQEKAQKLDDPRHL